MRASEITPQELLWLMHPFFPLGKISALAGQMGQAKTLFSLWLAAETSTGRLDDRTPGNVVLFSAEDDPSDTTRPRLEAAGADLSRVWIDDGGEFTADKIRQLSQDFGPLRLVVADPIQAFFPSGTNSWKGQEVRRFLDPIRQLAAELSVAVVLIQHLNRREASDPLARISDSQGITQLARAVAIWGPNPNDPEGDHGSTKVLTRAKGNLARGGASATFEIVELEVTDGLRAPALVRGQDSNVTAEDVVADRETRSATDEAADWLQELLVGGPMKVKRVMAQARDDGISERTLRRAKARVGVRSESVRNSSGISEWNWRLIQPAGNVGSVGNLGHVETLEANAAKVAIRNGVPG